MLNGLLSGVGLSFLYGPGSADFVRGAGKSDVLCEMNVKPFDSPFLSIYAVFCTHMWIEKSDFCFVCRLIILSGEVFEEFFVSRPFCREFVLLKKFLGDFRQSRQAGPKKHFVGVTEVIEVFSEWGHLAVPEASSSADRSIFADSALLCDLQGFLKKTGLHPL